MHRRDEIDWRLRAACRGEDPDLFYPEPGDASLRIPALRVCARCSVRETCLRVALDTGDVEFGIRGGMAARTRKRLLAEQGRVAAAEWVAQVVA